jgi:hypothetical protein
MNSVVGQPYVGCYIIIQMNYGGSLPVMNSFDIVYIQHCKVAFSEE